MADLFKALSSLSVLSTKAKYGSLWFRKIADRTYAEVVSLPGLDAVAVAANTPLDATKFGDVEFQFDAGGPVTVTRSLDGVKPYVPWPVSDKLGQSAMSAPSPDIYGVDGKAWLKFSAPVVVTGGA